MDKCVFVNLDVGSAIEQSGNEVLEHIKKIKDLDISVFTDQTRESIFFKFLLEKLPNIIIINSSYPRIIGPTIFYKLLYNNTKIVLISRVIADFVQEHTLNSNYSIYDDQRWSTFTEMCDLIICVNSCGRFKKHVPSLSHKTLDICGLNNPQKFEISKPWKDRTKDFILFGSLRSHKVSPYFLELLKNTEIQIDCYGVLGDDEIPDLINNIPNTHYKGFCEFDKVPELLNEYKYGIFPHNGFEPFCNSLQQSILCGTIPIVLDDNYKNPFGDYWLHWGNNLYIPAKNEEELVDILLSKINNESDEELSNKLRNSLISRYKLDKIFSNINNEIKLLLGKGIKWNMNI